MAHLTPLQSWVVELLQELRPEDVVKRTASRTFTAQQMIDEIALSSVEGKTFATELLQISRDFIARQSS